MRTIYERRKDPVFARSCNAVWRTTLSCLGHQRWGLVVALLLVFASQRECSGFVQSLIAQNAITARPSPSISALRHRHSHRCRPAFHPDLLRLQSKAQVDSQFADRFAGIDRLYGAGAAERLRNSNVCVVGLGGVGSWVVEALARSGVGFLTIVDADEVCISNTNRQLCALTSTVGKPKASVMADRAQDINPDCQVTIIAQFARRETVLEVLDPSDDRSRRRRIDFVVDAIDGVDDKSALLAACVALQLPVVTCGGAGGLSDPSQIARSDLTRAHEDTLLFKVRKKMRQRYGFPQGRPNKPKGLKEWNIPTIFSTQPLTPPPPPLPSSSSPSSSHDTDDDDGSGSSFRSCDVSFGTSSVVTGAFGLAAASVAIEQLATGHPTPPTVTPGKPKDGFELGRQRAPAPLFE